MIHRMFKIILITVFVTAAMIYAQDRYLDCGRLGLNVGSSGSVGSWDWPRDFRYASNGGSAYYHVFVEDWTDVEGTTHDYFFTGQAQIGGWRHMYNRKKVRYPYPTIYINEKDITSTSIIDGDPEPNLISDQMVETLANTYVGLTFHQRTFMWSHPEYQDLAITHLQIINTGNIDSDEEIELPNNDFSQFYLALVEHLNPGQGSHDELCDITHTKSDRASTYSDVQIVKWEGDEPDNPGVPNYDRPQLLHWSVGNDPNDTWFGKSVDNEGDPKPESGEFMSPMYLGTGLVHIDKSATDRSNDFSKHILCWWDTYYWLYHGATETYSQRYDVFRNGFGGDRFQTDNDHDDPDPLTGGQRALNTFGPWELAQGDTINLVFFHGVGGVDHQICLEKGAQWLDWWKNGQGDFNNAKKNQLLRTGYDSLVTNYDKAKQIWENGLELPEGNNPFPPSGLTVSNMDSNYLKLEWTPPSKNAGDVVKYNIYYSEGSRDARYELLDEINVEDAGKEKYEYIYRKTKPGFAYYFNLTAEDAEGRESSKYMCRTNRLAIHPGLAQGNVMDDVRIVPNPFVYDPDAVKNYPGEKDKIMVAGLPPGRTMIRFYTLTGDLVREFMHDASMSMSGGNEGLDYSDLKKERRFLTITKYNQFMASGVYIYHVESLDGYGEKTGKFIVIR